MRNLPQTQTAGNDGTGGEGGAGEERLVIPYVSGIQYEGEELKDCPLCQEKTMWYYLPGSLEVLACSSPTCVWPFDDASPDEPYEVRERNHGKKIVTGPPLAIQAQAEGTDQLSSSGPLEVFNADGMCTVKYEETGEVENLKNNEALVQSVLMEFMNMPKEERTKKEVCPPPFIDLDAVNSVKSMITAIDNPIDD